MNTELTTAWMERFGQASGRLISDWLTIEQEMVTQFGQCTLDPDPLHIDPEYARTYGAFGGPIAFGFQTMSLLTHFYRSVIPHSRTGYALNYGFNRVRLPNAVRVGQRIRGVMTLLDVEERGGDKFLATYEVTVEIDGEPRPALAGEWLCMWVDDGVARPDAFDTDGSAN